MTGLLVDDKMDTMKMTLIFQSGVFLTEIKILEKWKAKIKSYRKTLDTFINN